MNQLTLSEMHIGRPRQLGPLTVFPLWTPAAEVTAFVRGDVAEIVISEISDSPDYRRVIVTNLGDSPALLLEGELLVGGMQHRAIASDVVIAPWSSLEVAVMCVEHGRWNGDHQHTYTGHRVPPSIRAAATGIDSDAAQAEVWSRVSGLESIYGASATESYVEIKEAAGCLPSVRYEPLPGQVGVLVGAAGYPALAEIYSSTEALDRSIEALLESVLLEAMALPGANEPVPDRRARRMIGRLEALPLRVARDHHAGLATSLESRSEKVVVRATEFDGSIVHVVAFDRRHALARV